MSGPRLASAFAGFDELTATSVITASMEFDRAALSSPQPELPVTGQAMADWLPLSREATLSRACLPRNAARQTGAS